MANKNSGRNLNESSVGKTVSEIDEMVRRKTFSNREVGLNHPDSSSFIRLTDSGDIEIFAAPGVGIVINGATRSISLFAENIKFFTKEDGLKWNGMDFNHSATSYAEPALVNSDIKSYNPAYLNLDDYINNLQKLEEEETQQTITISDDPTYNVTTDNSVVDTGRFAEDNVYTGFTKEEIKYIQSFWDSNGENIKLHLNKNLEEFINLIKDQKSKNPNSGNTLSGISIYLNTIFEMLKESMTSQGIKE